MTITEYYSISNRDVWILGLLFLQFVVAGFTLGLFVGLHWGASR